MELLKPASLSRLSFTRVSGFSRNRLAVGHVPPGGLCVLLYFSGFAYEPPGSEGCPARRRNVRLLILSFWLVCQRCRGVWVVFLLYIFYWHDVLWDCSY